MILQALKEYYDRKAADPDSGIAPLGWEWKSIPFLVVIDRDGSFLRLEDTRELRDNKLKAKSFLVPSLGEAKGNGTKANLFWENGEYLFGIPMDAVKLEKDGEKYQEKVHKRHTVFVEKIKQVFTILPTHEMRKAIEYFVENPNIELLKKDPAWDEASKLNQHFLLSIDDVGIVTENEDIRAAVDQMSCVTATEGNMSSLCLVTGTQDIPNILEPPIKGVRGASTMGAHLVSVNNTISDSGNGGATPAFASFMKEQGANSPIGKRASLAYTTALNSLLAPDSKQKIQVGDATTIFWSAKKVLFEDACGSFFAEPSKDNPDSLVRAVETLFSSVDTGAFATDDDDTRFYVLGLAPNSARISVRFWYAGTVAEMAKNFRQYFDDLRIIHAPWEMEHLSLWRLLVSTAARGKSENITPNLAGHVMRSILDGTPFPDTLLKAILTRVKAEREVSYPRAKLIKGCLNRKFRINNTTKERSLEMSLDNENTNIGYRLGRLFATLVQCQRKAQPGGKDMKTISDRFYAAASTCPSTVFSNLMRLNKHHLAKIEHGRSFYEGLIRNIMQEVTVFPSHLSQCDQGQFAIGFYHQQMAFVTFVQESVNKQKQ